MLRFGLLNSSYSGNLDGNLDHLKVVHTLCVPKWKNRFDNKSRKPNSHKICFLP